MSLCLCQLYGQACQTPTLTQTHMRTNIHSLWAGGIRWVGRIQTAIIQARESASSTTPEESLLDRDNTLLSESDSPHQSLSRSVTDYPVFGRNERREGKHWQGRFNRLQNESIGAWVEKRRRYPKAQMYVMYHSANSNGKLETGITVHGYIFKSVWEPFSSSIEWKEISIASFYQPTFSMPFSMKWWHVSSYESRWLKISFCTSLSRVLVCDANSWYVIFYIFKCSFILSIPIIQVVCVCLVLELKLIKVNMHSGKDQQ